MYYNLINDIRADFKGSLEEPENIKRKSKFISGSTITEELPMPLVFTTDAKTGDAMVDFSKGTVTLMSERFFNLLKDAGVDNLQLFPAIVKSETDGTVWDNYFAVNVLGLIACADLDKSEYDEIMPGHYGFDKLAINAEKAKDVLLFRLHEHSPTILVRNSVLNHIVKNDPDKSLMGWTARSIIQ